MGIFGAVLGRVLAEREGVVDPAALNKITIVGGIMGDSLPSVMIVRELARREVPTQARDDVVTTPGDGGTPTEPDRVAVPDVVGQSQDQAVGTLTDLGLVASTRKVRSDTAEGFVIDQLPVEKTLVALGSGVLLTVSQGDGKVDVPEVKGKSKDEAVEILKKADFKIEMKKTSGDRDKVIVVDPEKRALPRSTILLYVGDGTQAAAQSKGGGSKSP